MAKELSVIEKEQIEFTAVSSLEKNFYEKHTFELSTAV